MPINQFNFKPKGFGTNQETTGTVKTGSGNYYNDYYYRSPEYDRLTGGIGAGNSSYGLRNTTNANRLDPNKELYERTLGELVSTLVGNSDTTQINKYVAPSYSRSRSNYREPEYISLNNIDYGTLYKLGDVSDEIAKAQAIMRANGYNVGVTGVYDTNTRNLMDDWKSNNNRTNNYGNTFGNKTIDTFNNAANKVTVADFNKMYKSTGSNNSNNYGATGVEKSTKSIKTTKSNKSNKSKKSKKK